MADRSGLSESTTEAWDVVSSARTQDASEAWSDRGSMPEDDDEMDELERQMAQLDVFIQDKNMGALSTSLIGPFSGLARVSAHVDWVGDDAEARLSSDRNKGAVAASHASFGNAFLIFCATSYLLGLP
jgi:hypothetical protein